MYKKRLIIEFVEHTTLQDEVDESDISLINKAENKLQNSYSPYSQFKVSSALKLSNGDVVIGTNQENAAYPSGICAERVALFSANSNFPDQNIDAIAIVTEQNNPLPFSPCGACRQVMLEYEMNQKKPIKVILKSGNSKIWIFKSVNDILPFGFDANEILKKG
jgi:cytidine deaminase